MSDLRRALALYGSKQYAAALPLLHAALLRSEQTPGGPSSAETADILFRIGFCYDSQSDNLAAWTHYRRAAAICNYTFKNRIGASLNAVNALRTGNAYTEAEKQINITISMIDTEAAAGTTAPAVLRDYRAEALLRSASCLLVANRFSEALPLCEENVAYYESIGDTPKLIECLAKLGPIYFEQGLSDKALATAQRAHSLTPRDAHSLVKLGSLLASLNLLDAAMKYFHTALECEEKGSGKNTLVYARILRHIGAGHAQDDQPDVALTWFHRARAVYENLNLTNTSSFGTLLHNIGVAYFQKGSLSDALAHYTRAEALYRGTLPPDHPSFTLCMHNISVVNARLGNADAAAAAAAAAASTARRSQVQCAAAGCPRKLKADGTPLDQCGGCKRCYYCSKACQTADWKAGHKAECKALRSGK